MVFLGDWCILLARRSLTRRVLIIRILSIQMLFLEELGEAFDAVAGGAALAAPP